MEVGTFQEDITWNQTGFSVNVSRCQRCGQDHVGMHFMPLDNPADEYKHWAMCPVKTQPILLMVTDD